MKKVTLVCLTILLFASYLSAQFSDVRITLENNRVLEGKADKRIITKGFEGLLFYQEQEHDTSGFLN